jgi:hypothetical protein
VENWGPRAVLNRYSRILPVFSKNINCSNCSLADGAGHLTRKSPMVLIATSIFWRRENTPIPYFMVKK